MLPDRGGSVTCETDKTQRDQVDKKRRVIKFETEKKGNKKNRRSSVTSQGRMTRGKY